VGVRTAMVGFGYVIVWAAFGAVLFPLGALAAEAQTRWPALAGTIVIAASALQFTRWKARQLACCREAPARGRELDARAAVRHGLRLGVHCVACCAGPMAALLVMGMMDWRAIVAVTAAITFERIAPSADRAARIVGVLGLATGIWLVAA
jgi:predicted metal-binding membrane protein